MLTSCTSIQLSLCIICVEPSWQ